MQKNWAVVGIAVIGLMAFRSASAEVAIETGGTVEIEANSAKNYAKEKTSDLSFATAELVLDAKVNQWSKAHVQFLYEQGATPFEVDEGTITISNEKSNPFSLTAGLMYVPFGKFESNMVSDPLTLEMGETRETALSLGATFGPVTATFFTFNGDTIEAETFKNNEDKLDKFGFSAEIGLGSEEGLGATIGASYISSLGDSNGLGDNLKANPALSDGNTIQLEKYVAGVSGFFSAHFAGFTLSAEIVQAQDTFTDAEVAFGPVGAQPSASMLEIAYTTQIVGSELTLAFSTQATEEAVALGLPEKRNLFGARYSLFEKTSLALEIGQDEDYAVTLAPGTGESASFVNAQIAVEF